VECSLDADFSPAAEMLASALGAATEPATVGFLDTETTGLAGGTGTVAFLVGLAQIDGDRLRVEQIFMPDYGDEPALLERLRVRLAGFRALVTYNGKTFDMPLLRTRWGLQREREPEEMPHLDLLHVARRFFSHRMRGCGLANVERAILNFEREGDLPGRAAPKAYTRYLSGHELETMAEVFRHNETDLLATALLLARLAAFFARPAERGWGEPGDWLGLAEWAEQIGHHERARDAFRLALGTLGATPQRTRVELKLADVCRRLDREDEARDLWREVAERDPLAGWPAVREIVRWHESRAEWGEAFRTADATWQRFEQVRSLRSVGGEARLPTAWRQWMGECERLRESLRQASGEEQLTLPI
jgi:hypothetical protein